MVDVQYHREKGQMESDDEVKQRLTQKLLGDSTPQPLGWPIDLNHYEFTTGVSIVPDTFPFPDCHGSTGPNNCTGTLV